MAEFVGLNTHTVQFRPELYAPVTRNLRNYHPMSWDWVKGERFISTLPTARNGVQWHELYGGWRAAGFRTISTIMFEEIKEGEWTDRAAEAREYGRAYAETLGGLLDAVEIGNEPKDYSDEGYRDVFRAMAAGLRSGDPNLKVATCAAAVGRDDPWSRDLAVFEDLTDGFGVISVHRYPFADGWPTWRRTMPEDPANGFLPAVRAVTDWRDAHAPDKAVWVTEYGYDASTKSPDPNGEWAQWVGVSDLDQARYLVRATLALATLAVERAYVFWFNDDDVPQLHGSSGLTRRYEPKPSYWAMAQVQRVLGESRLVQVVRQDTNAWVLEFATDAGLRTWVAWAPSGSSSLALEPGSRVEPLQTTSEVLSATPARAVELGPDPVYVKLP